MIRSYDPQSAVHKGRRYTHHTKTKLAPALLLVGDVMIRRAPLTRAALHPPRV